MTSAPPTPANPTADPGRHRLLDAAVEAFGTRGYAATSTRDIAGAVGMSPAALYVHYGSKEELLYAICRSGHHTIAGLVDAALTAPDPRRRMSVLVATWAERHATHHTMGRVVHHEIDSLTPSHRSDIVAVRCDIERKILRVVADGTAEGTFDAPDPEVAARAVISLIVDVSRWYRPGGRYTPEQIGAQYVPVALRILGARA